MGEAGVFPGFVDIQVNGAFGFDFTTDPDSIWNVGAKLPSTGVTAFVPTVITTTEANMKTALRVVGLGPPAGYVGATVIGLHLEGPMLAAERRGTHPLDLLQPASLELVDRLLETGQPLMVTLAPELPGVESVIDRLVDAGVIVSFGHSDCTATAADAGFERGVGHVTHLFNAMSGLHHRSPGLAASVLNSDTVTAGVIVDGVHLDPAMVQLAFRVLGPERIALVTDAVAAAGMAGGTSAIGSVAVAVNGVEVRNADGTLAGSAATMEHIVGTMHAITRCSRDELVAMSSTTPARIVHHIPDPGDTVVLDDDLRVASCSIGGAVVYAREGSH